MHNVIEIRKRFRSLTAYSSPLIYWDAAATALKLDIIAKVVDWFDCKLCANPGRASYFTALTIEAVTDRARQSILNEFCASRNKMCIFYKSTTEALNAMLQSCINNDDQFLACVSDHNSMIGPLVRRGNFALNDLDEDGLPAIKSYLNMMKRNRTQLLLTHASNVLGLAIPTNLYA
ncbi:MAG: aminotransferase class V-fold PLP-dependent enzyme, partial [Candidatus Hodgkinia cicadicola]